MSIRKIIIKFRKQLNLTQAELCENINKQFHTELNKSMISKWENGKSNPSLDYAKILALYFNVSLDDILGLKISAESLSLDEANLIIRYRSLNSEGKEKLQDQAELLSSSPLYKNNRSTCVVEEAE